MRPPKGIFPGEGIGSLGLLKDKAKYGATGEYRPPRKGEYYLSGAIVAAYRAPNDLSTAYWIARELNMQHIPARDIVLGFK